MARAVGEDFLQGMRYHVKMLPGITGGVRSMARKLPNVAEAGFSSVTIPSASTDGAEYREGHYIYTRKQPGIPTMEDITLQRGVTRQDTAFWDWARQGLEGQGEYREDFQILHFQRDNALNPDLPANPRNAIGTMLDTSAPAAMTYEVHESFPLRTKPAGDLDATATDISLAELDVSYEYFNVIPGPLPS